PLLCSSLFPYTTLFRSLTLHFPCLLFHILLLYFHPSLFYSLHHYPLFCPLFYLLLFVLFPQLLIEDVGFLIEKEVFLMFLESFLLNAHGIVGLLTRLAFGLIFLDFVINLTFGFEKPHHALSF